jgi:predicted HAD superfamily phosphohydrolase YqeG
MFEVEPVFIPHCGKLLIFDLDETLIHTNESGEGEPVDIVTSEGL